MHFEITTLQAGGGRDAAQPPHTYTHKTRKGRDIDSGTCVKTKRRRHVTRIKIAARRRRRVRLFTYSYVSAARVHLSRSVDARSPFYRRRVAKSASRRKRSRRRSSRWRTCVRCWRGGALHGGVVGGTLGNASLTRPDTQTIHARLPVVAARGGGGGGVVLTLRRRILSVAFIDKRLTLLYSM